MASTIPFCKNFTKPQDLVPLLVLRGLATGASWLCYFYAIKIGDVSKVVPIDNRWNSESRVKLAWTMPSRDRGRR